jgi:hypothetical protein
MTVIQTTTASNSCAASQGTTGIGRWFDALHPQWHVNIHSNK